MDYRARYLVFFVLCLILSEYEANDSAGRATTLSRKRRYVVFPEGSSFSVSVATRSRDPREIALRSLFRGRTIPKPAPSSPTSSDFHRAL